METLQLNVKKRKEHGKSDARRLRKDGFLPAVLYGGENNIPLIINAREFAKILETMRGTNVLLNIKFEGETKNGCIAIIKDLQRHPLRKGIIHADLMEVSMDREIKIKVKVTLLGTPIGVKEKAGVLTQQMREIRLSCLPTNIPKEITIDVSNLDVGNTIHIRDILPGEGVTMLETPDATVVSVNIPKVEEVKEEVAVEAAPAEVPAEAPAEEKAVPVEEKKKEK
ncbi:MAG: hypothetical protein A3I04_02510 [Nitrospinae bacterium RIFCSPLOWO2_02_FULL_39_110]|nr:MAG: hypothetical protein A2W53_01830 [Nitrospinae bacterium RIFCSPHIGHO2_02_39_11]OGV98741.1 MAG: hypothetical protein A3D97_05460 [Nitrospinae bacterium RIFCSPHIGHO2_12_FULL_39_42]OGW00170.1 MAG: hypothetical protein A3D20_06965 [Nitrospinae bacterium RIFCSPHIGHO2_02_FULL_39_82]OGW04338.1 MAG: hypothetical protein A3I04_02510 [Nitrospinae bacterium RIFCSPLOWO2_02_FULL_39_110]OGW07126.1 MAG: hypothetical protein A2Z59_09070 [Nitrospinae bacterium RIFCSPLOWO2_02_39_17]OGW09487.1 MAG: hypoth